MIRVEEIKHIGGTAPTNVVVKALGADLILVDEPSRNPYCVEEVEFVCAPMAGAGCREDGFLEYPQTPATAELT
jgi:hypothetical protein